MKGTNYMTKSTYKTNNLKSTKEWQDWSNETVKTLWNNNKQLVENYGTEFVRFDTKSYELQKEWAPGFYSEKLPKIQCQLKKPVYYLMEEQGETYFKHA
jgi:hypothetical protein